MTHTCCSPKLGVPSARPVEPHVKPVREGCLLEASPGVAGRGLGSLLSPLGYEPAPGP